MHALRMTAHTIRIHCCCHCHCCSDRAHQTHFAVAFTFPEAGAGASVETGALAGESAVTVGERAVAIPKSTKVSRAISQSQSKVQPMRLDRAVTCDEL